MKLAKKTAEYTVLKRADDRYAIQGNDKKFINGEDKVKILIKEGFLTAPTPKTDSSAEAETTSEVAES